MKKTEYLFKEIIEEIKEVYLEEGETKLCADSQWCVYAKSSDLELESACYVLPYPAYDVETDEETFPELAVQNGLDVVYTHFVVNPMYAGEKHTSKKYISAAFYELVQREDYKLG